MQTDTQFIMFFVLVDVVFILSGCIARLLKIMLELGSLPGELWRKPMLRVDCRQLELVILI